MISQHQVILNPANLTCNKTWVQQNTQVEIHNYKCTSARIEQNPMHQDMRYALTDESAQCCAQPQYLHDIPSLHGENKRYTRHLLHQTTFTNTFLHQTHETPFTLKQLLHQRPVHTRSLLLQTRFYTRQLLQTPFYTRSFFYTKATSTPNTLHQTPFTPSFTPDTFYCRHILHQTPFTLYTKHLFTEALYTRHLLHQTPFTPNTFSHQKPFTPDTFYTRQLLHQTRFYTKATFTPDTFHTSHLLHQTPFTHTQLVGRITCRTVSRLGTTPPRYGWAATEKSTCCSASNHNNHHNNNNNNNNNNNKKQKIKQGRQKTSQAVMKKSTDIKLVAWIGGRSW